MKNKLFTLAAALTLAAVIGGIYAAPALAAVIKAALVKNVDEPGRTPYSVRSSCVSTINNCAATFAAIPDGSRFVVEYITVQVSPQSTPNAIAEIKLQNSLGAVKSYLGAVPHADTGLGSVIYSSSNPVRAFFEPGEIPIATFALNNAGIVAARAVLTGYLVDLTI